MSESASGGLFPPSAYGPPGGLRLPPSLRSVGLYERSRVVPDISTSGAVSGIGNGAQSEAESRPILLSFAIGFGIEAAESRGRIPTRPQAGRPCPPQPRGAVVQLSSLPYRAEALAVVHVESGSDVASSSPGELA